MAGIYIHIPFCKKLCFYCDFYHVVSVNDNSAFIDALLKEASLRIARQQIGQRRFSSAVRADHRVDVVAKKIKRHVVDCGQAAKALGQVFG